MGVGCLKRRPRVWAQGPGAPGRAVRENTVPGASKGAIAKSGRYNFWHVVAGVYKCSQGLSPAGPLVSGTPRRFVRPSKLLNVSFHVSHTRNPGLPVNSSPDTDNIFNLKIIVLDGLPSAAHQLVGGWGESRPGVQLETGFGMVLQSAWHSSRVCGPAPMQLQTSFLQTWKRR